MTCVGFLILFGLSCVLFPCEGQIILPPGGNSLTVLNGSNVTIEWSLDPSLSTGSIRYRSWTFRSSRGGNEEFLADISRVGTISISTKLYEVDIEEPATLVLKNVNGSYNGTYQFTLLSPDSSNSEVVVFITEKPNVTFSCSSPITINEGENFTCVCRGEGGNPPANVTWYKDNEMIGGTGKGPQRLTLSNVNGTVSGNYTCVAQSHTNATDEKSIEVKVRLNFKPNNTNITFTPENAVVGGSVTITCNSDGLPEPSYNITHNGTMFSTKKTYAIYNVQYSDAGTYKCIARNKLGNDSACANLTVKEVHPATTPPMTPTMTPTTLQPSSKSSQTITITTKDNKTDKPSSNDAGSGIEWYIVAVILVSGIIIVILLCYIVWCSRRRWLRNRKPERNPEAQTTEADSTYQALDLTKMNTEDNYQSLRSRKPQSNPEPQTTEADTTYQALDLTKMNTEDNYQSLRSRKPQSNPEPQTTEADTTYQELDLTKMNTEDNYQSLRSRKPQSNPEPQTTEADTTYQELDLTKMNTEDNYQSLRVNAARNDVASNDDDSTYTELNKTRDEENNYQSLT